MLKQIVELGTITIDKPTGLKGMVTHYTHMGKNEYYQFQPSSINPETGHPVGAIAINEDRLTEAPRVEVDLPVEVLNTEVTDKATGLSGTAIGIVLHQNGCVHIYVQPKGSLAKTGAPVESIEMDIRRLTGPAIKPMTKAERLEDQKKRPSPMGAAIKQAI